MNAYRALVGTVLVFKLSVLVVNALTFPRLRRGDTPAGPAPSVSLLVPARNEAENLRRNLPGLLAQGAYEVLVLDDASHDQTAQVAANLGATVLTGQALPGGWGGKNWACWQLAQAARAEVLIFTDADVTWQVGALGALLAQLGAAQPQSAQLEAGADLLSVFPRQRNVTLGERLLTPLVDDILLSGLPAPVLKVPHPSASAANGQVMAFRRACYEQIGGHAAVRANLLEDIALGRLVKASGQVVALALGQDLIGVRMYRSYAASVEGFAKGILTIHGGSRLLLLLSFAACFSLYTLPLLRRDGPLLALGLLEGLLARVIAGRTRPADLAEALLTPLIPPLTLPVYLRALRREVAWKGRHYQQGGRP